ncbi:hypothetical protein WP39_17440 [Streptomyces sp. 604F]|nr:hypothetical protein [Streptomyces sp. 604F]
MAATVTGQEAAGGIPPDPTIVFQPVRAKGVPDALGPWTDRPQVVRWRRQQGLLNPRTLQVSSAVFRRRCDAAADTFPGHGNGSR